MRREPKSRRFAGHWEILLGHHDWPAAIEKLDKILGGVILASGVAAGVASRSGVAAGTGSGSGPRSGGGQSGRRTRRWACCVRPSTRQQGN